MASYFVASHARPDGVHAVHDRGLCPPACFPVDGATEYLGEFCDLAQAVAVARLRYEQARGCASCEQVPVTRSAQPALLPLRS